MCACVARQQPLSGNAPSGPGTYTAGKPLINSSRDGKGGLDSAPDKCGRVLRALRQARKVESELEGRLATYAKLCSAYADGAYRGRGEAGLATDQVRFAFPFCVGKA